MNSSTSVCIGYFSRESCPGPDCIPKSGTIAARTSLWYRFYEIIEINPYSCSAPRSYRIRQSSLIQDLHTGGIIGRKPTSIDPPKRSGRSYRKASRAGTSQRRAGVTESLRICSIAGGMKRNRKRMQRLGEKCYRGGNREGSSHPATGTNTGAEVAGDRNPKTPRGGVSCGAVHSQAREACMCIRRRRRSR